MPQLTTRIKTENGNYIAATPLFFESIGFAWITENNEVLKPATANEWIWATTSWGNSENLPVIERGNFGEFEWNAEVEKTEDTEYEVESLRVRERDCTDYYTLPKSQYNSLISTGREFAEVFENEHGFGEDMLPIAK